MAENPRATFLVSAPDQPGLVARLAGFFYARGLNIIDSSTHSDPWAAGGPRFFLRLAVVLDAGNAREELEQSFAALVTTLAGTWSAGYSDRLSRVTILVTREPACLYDLLLRQKMGELACEVPLIIGNRTDLQPVAASFGIPFVEVPMTPQTRAAGEEQMLALIAAHRCDLVVLARYMQILSGEFVARAPVAINIHHGFLPAFQGARPYHQAHERGVKIIGATAHYVTRDLDQGPIIEQDVERVTHQMGPQELARVGRDIERVVLARAVRAHLEHRILLEGRRTMVL